MSEKLDIVILGAGGFGREMLEMLWQCFPAEQYRFKGFLAQSDASLKTAGLSAPVLADPESYEPRQGDRFLLGIGEMKARRRTVEAITSKGGVFLSFLHPLARIASTASIGNGAVIYPFAVVSNASKLDEYVHLNYFASVGHDCQVGRYCLLAPYATLNGFVRLKDEAYISTHATVAPGRTIGCRSKLSANSAAMQDAADDVMVFGVPGKQVKRLS
jgi:sugar O-acyltransferase (sialic acid O-acetyltransferase NeuD family)